MTRSWSFSLLRIYREGNQCTDHLVKLGATGDQFIVILHEAPGGLHHLLLADALGISLPRG